MQDYTYITQTGTIVPDTADVQAQVTSEFLTAFGQDLITDPNTPQGLLITAETLARQTVITNNAALANQINPNLAGGVYLDAIAALTGGFRNPQVFSTVLCNLTGVPTTVISAGAVAKDTNGNIWASISTVSLDSDGNASVDFQAVLPGSIALSASDLNIIVQGPLGWETITNPDAAIPGSITQSDESYRFYRRMTLALQGSSLAEAITSALYATNGVLSVFFQENVSNVTTVINGVSMVPHSLYACVDGGTDADVATTILSKKSGGCNYNGTFGRSVTVDVLEPASGQTFPVTFDRPTIIQILVRVTIAPSSLVANPNQAVIDAIVDYANGKLTGEPGLTVGTPVSPFELSGAINIENPSIIFVRKVEISYASPISYVVDQLAINVFEVANIASSAITVVIM